jgi:hypothetical protein
MGIILTRMTPYERRASFFLFFRRPGREGECDLADPVLRSETGLNLGEGEGDDLGVQVKMKGKVSLSEVQTLWKEGNVRGTEGREERGSGRAGRKGHARQDCEREGRLPTRPDEVHQKGEALV